MLSLLQNAQGTTRSFQKARPFTLHCSLLLLVLLYAFLGGLIFNKLEAEALVRQQNDEYDKRRNCVLEILLNWNDEPNETATTIMECWKKEADERTEWSYVTSTLYGFGIVTTLDTESVALTRQQFTTAQLRLFSAVLFAVEELCHCNVLPY
uniref:Ion_trans_2 domain-containing protein n=1 Tax=Ascaris lumbricoides TaxID=6252 RepID=A0A0M3HUZ1_ASCLU